MFRMFSVSKQITTFPEWPPMLKVGRKSVVVAEVPKKRVGEERGRK